MNTVYFCKSLDRGFEEIHRVLVPGGSAVIGFLPREFMDRMGFLLDIFTGRTIDEVVAALRRAGGLRHASTDQNGVGRPHCVGRMIPAT